jgi:protein pelota
MKIIFKDLKKGNIKVQAENLEDLWYLSHIIDVNDIVSGKTFRKIKIGQEPNVKVIKKQLFLKIEVEKVELHKFSNSLRVSGKVVEGTDDVGKGSHHTFDVKEGTVISIHKNKWYSYQIEKLNEAVEEKKVKVLICVLDRENASFALMKNLGFEMLTKIESDLRKKRDEGKETRSNYFSDIVKIIKEYVDRYDIEDVIIASPAFWKEEVLKELKKSANGLKAKITLATCNATGKNGVAEVLKREEVKTVIAQGRAMEEVRLVDRLLEEIAKDGNVAYGIKDVESASEAGAVEVLLVLDELIHEYKTDNKYEQLDRIMKNVDNSKGKVMIVAANHEGGNKLKGLGGIAALLRYKLY